ncbi:hypothetical protein [Dactylosporangium sp. NPDC006015]|uniref:hypothetical protein n=1 Tax=Dactylosporangium sp. NPDC006015 TaxID=3154576 RepID=UPI0033A32614
MSEAHRPVQPSWTCGTCQAPWPCEPRRIRFAADYAGRRQELRAVLALFMISALDDLIEPIEVVHSRFVGWVSGHS